MKTVLFVMVLVLVCSLSLAISQTKKDDNATTSTNSSCCMHATKVSMAADKSMKGSKECTMSAAKSGKECPEMTKISGKMDCCKGMAKGAKASNTIKKSTQAKTVEAKGTN